MKISVETRKPPIAKNVKAFQVRLTSLMSFKTGILTIKLKKLKEIDQYCMHQEDMGSL